MLFFALICLECHQGKSRCRIVILFVRPDNKPESDLTGEVKGGQPDLTEMQKAH